MAKSRTKHKVRRHRRVGALSMGRSSTGMKLLSIGAGYLLADTINPQIDKILPKTTDASGVEMPNETIGIVGEVGIGGLLLMSKRGNQMLKMGGGILAGAGLKRALKKMGVLKGYQSVPVIGGGPSRLAGYQATPVIGTIPPQLAGVPGQLQGFRVNGGPFNNGYDSQGSGVMGSVIGAGMGSCDYTG